jgi:YHS domain-containing protein
MKRWIWAAVGGVLVLVGGFAAINKISPVSWGWWGNYETSSGVALKGYDPVAYFKSGAPAKGSAEFSLDWGGAKWHFASAENQQAFEKSPESYAPQFGGFCAFAVWKAVTADSSPEAWYVEDGKLYLFANSDVQKQWVAEIPRGSLLASQKNWSRR